MCSGGEVGGVLGAFWGLLGGFGVPGAQQVWGELWGLTPPFPTGCERVLADFGVIWGFFWGLLNPLIHPGVCRGFQADFGIFWGL